MILSKRTDLCPERGSRVGKKWNSSPAYPDGLMQRCALLRSSLGPRAGSSVHDQQGDLSVLLTPAGGLDDGKEKLSFLVAIALVILGMVGRRGSTWQLLFSFISSSNSFLTAFSWKFWVWCSSGQICVYKQREDTAPLTSALPRSSDSQAIPFVWGSNGFGIFVEC